MWMRIKAMPRQMRATQDGPRNFVEMTAEVDVFFPRRVGTRVNRGSGFVQVPRRFPPSAEDRVTPWKRMRPGKEQTLIHEPQSVSPSLRVEASKWSQGTTVLITAIVLKLGGPTNPILPRIPIEGCARSSRHRQVPRTYGEDVDVNSTRCPLG